jgi:hypothetical protein
LYSDPNDWEFYLEGRIEGKAPAKIDPADAERLKKMGLDKLIGPGAWQLQNQENLSASIAPEDVVVSDSVETQDSLNNDNAIESGSVNAEL